MSLSFLYQALLFELQWVLVVVYCRSQIIILYRRTYRRLPGTLLAREGRITLLPSRLAQRRSLFVERDSLLDHRLRRESL